MAHVLTYQTSVNAADGLISEFGMTTAFLNGRLIVGAPDSGVAFGNAAGRVYVFSYDGILLQTIAPNAIDEIDGAEFGQALAASGNWLIVSARDVDVVYFFLWNGLEYEFKQRVTGSTIASGDEFGFSVAISVDATSENGVAVVGAIKDDDVAGNAGSAWIFELSSGVWTQTAKLLPPVVQASQNFGNKVGCNYDLGLVVVCAYQVHGTFLGEGACYTFEKNVTYPATPTVTFAPDNPSLNSYFGSALHVHGNKIAIGCSGYDAGVAPFHRGAVYVVTRTAFGSYSSYPRIDAPVRPMQNADFAGSDTAYAHDTVRLTDNYLIVGAPAWEDVSKVGVYGGAFLFQLIDGNYTFVDLIYPDIVGESGWSVDLDESLDPPRLCSAAYTEDTEDPLSTIGLVRIYSLEPVPIAPQPYWPWAREVTAEQQGSGVVEHPLIVRHSLTMNANGQADIRYFPLRKHGHWVRLAISTPTSPLPTGARLRIYAVLGGYDAQATLEVETEPEG